MAKNLIALLALIVLVSAEYKLVFDDPFSNLDNWVLDVTQWNTTRNNEWELYTDREENVRVETRDEENVLVITARAEEYYNYHYTSGRIHSKEEFGPYGFINVHALVPKGSGLWPAIWMLPTNATNEYGTWAACGEIDIMETVCTIETQSEAYGTLQFGGPWPFNQSYPPLGNNTYPFSVDWSKSHRFGVEWQPDFIKFWFDAELVDGVVQGTLVNTISSDVWWSESAPGVLNPKGAPFDKPFGIVMNIAVGGNWAMAIKDCCAGPILEEPAEMVVYEVKVYDFVSTEAS